VIQLSGYTEGEKVAIAKGYLIPRQVRENGLRPGEVTLTKEALKSIINLYTREAGVRNLERRIGAICRKIGTNIAEGKKQSARVTPKVVKELLGHPVFMETEEIDMRTSIPGVVPGLAWTPFGGDILFIEATKMPGAKGFQITGSVGNVMQESARAALSYVRSHADEIGLHRDFFDKTDIHMHIPAGAQPKDGPSAGVTMTTALVSLLSGRPVKKGVGMTGEVTLRGQVLPVGGIKEKMIAAHRAGLKTIIIPKRNEPDLEELPAEVRKSLSFVLAGTVNDVLQASLEKPARTGKKPVEKKRPANAPGGKKLSAGNASEKPA
jgi:ATP-dependent Lon protease